MTQTPPSDKDRDETTPPTTPRKTSRRIVIGAAIVAAVVALAVMASDQPEPIELGGVETFPDLGAEHIDPAGPTPSYNSNPPTSGPHAPVSAPCGIYLQVVPDIFAVHSLEHGAVVAWYSDALPEDDVVALQDFARDAGTHIVVAPRADAADPLTLTAWTGLVRLDGFDDGTVQAFYDQFAQAGPERGVPCPVQIDEPAEA